MSINEDDESYTFGMSSCCSAPIIGNTDICSECHDHCDNVEDEVEEEEALLEKHIKETKNEKA